MTINFNELPRGGTQCFSKAGLKIGTNTAATVDTAAPNGAGIDYAINGTYYHKADTTDMALTAAAIQPVLTRCIYLICLDSAGNLSSVKGTAQTTLDLLAGNAVLHWPTPVVDTCPIGAIKVETLVAGTFTAGTTALTAGATLATTYYDLTLIPASPLTS
jgi:hypothetical protein